MKQFCFTVDDNIRFLKELTASGCNSLFDHPYLRLFKQLHNEFNLKVQLNLFYKTDGFDLTMMTDRYKAEWAEHANWLKLSFHSEWENVAPYQNSGYDEVFAHCKAVQDEILRFAGADSLAKTTTIHYCLATKEGLCALFDNGVQGLLGLYGSPQAPRSSYQSSPDECKALRAGEVTHRYGIAYGAIDIVLNSFSKSGILTQLDGLWERQQIYVMIHEQYFYADYKWYQPDYGEKLRQTFETLQEKGYESIFFEEKISRTPLPR